jgi:WD40 repeat protein
MSGQVITSAGQSIFPGEYVVGLGRLDNALAAGLTDGSVQILPVEPSQTSRSSFKAHENTILGLEVIENAGVIATCGSDSVKLWDVRAGNKNIHKFTLEGRKNPLTCLTASGHRLAAGTELKDQDAGVVVWDVRYVTVYF